MQAKMQGEGEKKGEEERGGEGREGKGVEGRGEGRGGRRGGREKREKKRALASAAPPKVGLLPPCTPHGPPIAGRGRHGGVRTHASHKQFRAPGAPRRR